MSGDKKEFTVTVRLSGQAAERCSKILRIEGHSNAGATIDLGCYRESTTKRWFYCWRGRIDEAVQEALTDRPRSGRPDKEDAARKVRLTVERQRKKIKTIQGQLNALSAELDALSKATAELLQRTDDFIASEVAHLFPGEISACDAATTPPSSPRVCD